MTIDDKIRDEKLQYDINREAAKYQHYHQEKLINVNILRLKNIAFQSETNNRIS